MSRNRVKPQAYVQKSILGYLAIIQNTLPFVIAGRGREPLHQLRVTFRRLRNAFWVFRGCLPRTYTRRWSRKIKVASQDCGTARDLDVQILFLLAYQRTLHSKIEKQTLGLLIKDMRVQRARLQRKLSRSLKHKNFLATLAEVAAFIRKLDCEDLELKLVARKKIVRRQKELFKVKERILSPHQILDLHQMRIAAKHLRYTLEVFNHLLGRRSLYYIQHVIALQRVLGEIHDDDVWLQDLPELFTSIPSITPNAKSHLIKYCQKRRDLAYQKMQNLWQEYKQKEFWQNLNDFLKIKE